MYEFNEREIIFLKKWISEIMDVKWKYELIKPDLSERGLDTALYIKIPTEHGWLKHRIDLTIRELQFCTNEDLFKEMSAKNERD